VCSKSVQKPKPSAVIQMAYGIFSITYISGGGLAFSFKPPLVTCSYTRTARGAKNCGASRYTTYSLSALS